MRDSRVGYRSRFGGLWTDRDDANVLVEEGRTSGAFTYDEAKQLKHWIEHGWVALPGAVDPASCAALREALERDRVAGGSGLLAQTPDGVTFPFGPDHVMDGVRVVDVYWRHERALEILFSSAITAFLRLVFEEPPLLFQGLSFERGSEQGLHQDTFFVVVDRPLELAAAWIALEDVEAGSGELMYLDRSHEAPEYVFGGDRKHWNPDVDGPETLAVASQRLVSLATELGFERRTFLPRQGDVFIWSADLAHGGSPITRPGTTRASLVGHYCPATARPFYFDSRPERAVTATWGAGGEAYASEWYSLVGESLPTQYLHQLEVQRAEIDQLRGEADALRQAVIDAQRAAAGPPDPELIAGKDLARALWHRAVSRRKRVLRGRGR